MKKSKKILIFSSLLVTSLLPVVTLSCKNADAVSSKSKEINFVNEKNIKEQNWDVFLKYEYVDTLLNLAFKNEDEKQKFVENQRNISDDYLTSIKDYLLYSNNIVIEYHPNSISGGFSGGLFGGGLFGNNKKKTKKVIAHSEYKDKLDKLYKENWLWFLFNLNKFTFAYNDDTNFFDIGTDSIKTNIQQYSLEYTPFITLNTNEVIQYSVFNHNTDESIQKRTMYLLTKQGIILSIEIKITNEDDQEKIEIEASPFIEIYPPLLQSKSAINNFDWPTYVRAQILSKNVGESSRWVKMLFDDKYGGKPKRFTLVYLNNK
ncbi:hypothetical protein N8G13_02205 [Mycoplasma zalophi]|uniref:aromatic motif membrane protein n=1 Tax=Mycoplasma zalophi TaxID=191287 RepID=UPI0021C56E63|nr:aromatic motif membrane protein [Mycoplasma zalophi]MCU4117268.1 hypothetical protein [Mycoplasma zalophi]